MSYSDKKTQKNDVISGIECTVTNCQYNDNKKNCYASKINVGPMHAETDDDTKCATFKQKPSDFEM
jgi:hypothetical protein